MKQLKFVPNECKGDDPKFTGHIMLRVPNFDEKWELLEGMGLELTPDGQVDLSKTKSFSFVRKCVSSSKPFFAEVAIKSKEGTEYKTFDDLSNDDETHGILMNAALATVSGMKLGNG